jgi:hypothetical protein
LATLYSRGRLPQSNVVKAASRFLESRRDGLDPDLRTAL